MAATATFQSLEIKLLSIISSWLVHCSVHQCVPNAVMPTTSDTLVYLAHKLTFTHAPCLIFCASSEATGMVAFFVHVQWTADFIVHGSV